MAKVKINGLESVQLNIKNKFNKVIKNKQMLNEIGKTSVERMQFQARKAKPLQGKSKSPGKFPSGYPKSSTVMARRSIAKFNQTHSTFKATRGNLTITGQLIDALKFKIKGSDVTFLIKGSRKGYKRKSGKRSKTPKNEVVYSHLVDRNRNFRIIGFDDKLLKRINNIVKRTLRRAFSVK